MIGLLKEGLGLLAFRINLMMIWYTFGVGSPRILSRRKELWKKLGI